MDGADGSMAADVRESPTPATHYPVQHGPIPTSFQEDRTITPSVYAGYKCTLQEPTGHMFLNDKNNKHGSSDTARPLGLVHRRKDLAFRGLTSLQNDLVYNHRIQSIPYRRPPREDHVLHGGTSICNANGGTRRLRHAMQLEGAHLSSSSSGEHCHAPPVDRAAPPHIYNQAEYLGTLDPTQQNPNPHVQLAIPYNEANLVPYYNPTVSPHPEGIHQQPQNYFGIDSQAGAGQVAARFDRAIYAEGGETNQQPPTDDPVEASQVTVHYYHQAAHQPNTPATDHGAYAQAEDGQVATRYDHSVYIQAGEGPPPHDKPYLQGEAYREGVRFNPATYQQDYTGPHQDVFFPSQQYRTECIQAPAPQKVEDTLMTMWTDADECFSRDTDHAFFREAEVDLSSTNYDPQYSIDCGQSDIQWDHLPFPQEFPDQGHLQVPTSTCTDPNSARLEFEETAASSVQVNAAGHFESYMPVDTRVEDEPIGYPPNSNHPQYDSRPQPDPGGGNVEFALMMLKGMQRIDDTLGQLQENQRQFQNQLITTMQSFTDEVSTLKTSLEGMPRHTTQGRRQRRPPGEDLTQAMDIASLDLSPEEAQFQYLLSVLGKPKKALTAAEFKIRNQWNRLRSCIRKYIAMVMGADDDDSFYEGQPTLTEEQVKDYGRKDRNAESVFKDKRVHIDFERSWKKFSFNKEVRNIIIKGFLEAVNSGMYKNPPISPQFLDEFWVGHALDGRINTLRRIWKRCKHPLTEDQKRQASRKAAMSSRRQTLLESRTLAVERRKLLSRHLCLLEMLSPVHMSGDETDGNSKTYPREFRIINTKWQSAELKLFLRALDDLYRADWESGNGRRAVSGNEPRIRYETRESKSVNNPAPQGLWRNCYDEEWMARQKEIFVDELCVIDEDYDFTIPISQKDAENAGKIQEEGMTHVE